MTNPWIIDRSGGVTPEQLQVLSNLKLYVATPMYGEKGHTGYMESMIRLAEIVTKLGLEWERDYTTQESLVQRARNTLAGRFMNSNATHLLFIDSDIEFDPWFVLELLLTGKELIGGAYPKKEILWDRVKTAAKSDVPTELLAHCSGSHTAQWLKDGQITIKRHEPSPVDYLPTGFMLIARSALEKFNAHFPNLRYADYIDRGSLVTPFFHCEIDMRTGIYLSEDYWFCARAVEAGVQPYLAPWIDLAHIGTFRYEGCFYCSNGKRIHSLGPSK